MEKTKTWLVVCCRALCFGSKTINFYGIDGVTFGEKYTMLTFVYNFILLLTKCKQMKNTINKLPIPSP
jgi:hypothetical protein